MKTLINGIEIYYVPGYAFSRPYIVFRTIEDVNYFYGAFYYSINARAAAAMIGGDVIYNPD